MPPVHGVLTHPVRTPSVLNIQYWTLLSNKKYQSWAHSKIAVKRNKKVGAFCIIAKVIVASPFRHKGLTIFRIFACHWSSNSLSLCLVVVDAKLKNCRVYSSEKSFLQIQRKKYLHCTPCTVYKHKPYSFLLQFTRRENAWFGCRCAARIPPYDCWLSGDDGAVFFWGGERIRSLSQIWEMKNYFLAIFWWAAGWRLHGLILRGPWEILGEKKGKEKYNTVHGAVHILIYCIVQYCTAHISKGKIYM